ncbi:protein-disulfide reductase [Acrasis kona]|uniref:Protein-disulfide reductase n=1 Tax=Acrasis kona TaxID=1008807 RepID=A0AAW2ZDZ5_9EUKA
MRSTLLVLLLTLLLCVVNVESVAVEKQHGFSNEVNWLSDLQEAKSLSKQNGKPILVLISETWCHACVHLKRSIYDNQDFIRKSRDFVMLQIGNKAAPSAYDIGGEYVPRVFITSPSGQVQEHVINKNARDEYKYYYKNAAELISTMESVDIKEEL